MKATLEFNLPEDQNEYDTVNQAYKMQSFISDLEQLLRSWSKHGHPFEDADKAVESMREQFYKLSDQHDIDLYL